MSELSTCKDLRLTLTKLMVMVSFAACQGTRPVTLGPTADGRLQACSAKKNCVSTGSNDAEHRLDPWPLQGSPAESLRRVKTLVQSMPRTTLVIDREDYLYVEFESLVFRFVDDVEFFSPENGPGLQIRSASRSGGYDWGANRKRVEMIKQAYESR